MKHYTLLTPPAPEPHQSRESILLYGPDGTPIDPSSIGGGPGGPGADGLSAYQIAVENGFSGTEQEWLDSLVGPPGITEEEFGLGLDWIEFSGHSILAGGGSRIPPFGSYGYLLKQALGVKRVHDLAVGGAVACRPTTVANGDGGFAWVLRNLARPGQTNIRATPGAPYTPQSQLVLAHFGLNDMGALGAAKPLPFQNALRTILAGYCSTANFLYTHASWGYAGTGWTTLGLIDSQASTSDTAGIKYTTSVGAASTWTVPTDAPDGRVMHVRLWLNAVWAASTFGVRVRRNGVWTALPDLTIDPAANCDTSIINMHLTHTLRFGSGVAGDPYGAIALRAGDAIEITLKTGAGLAIDGAGIESDPLDGPVFVCPLPHKPATYTIWSATWPGGASMNDAAVDAWKDYERAVLAEFPGRVISDAHGLGVDLDAAGANRYTASPGTVPPPAGVVPDVANDGAHPTDSGHGKFAQYVASVVRASPLITDRIRSRPFVDPRPRAWKKPGQFNPAAAGSFSTGWSNFGNFALPDIAWRIDENRRTAIRGCVKAAAGATGIILSPGSLPMPVQLASLVGNQNDGVGGWSQRPVRVGGFASGSGSWGQLTNGGAVVTAAGNLLEFDGTYQAEA